MTEAELKKQKRKSDRDTYSLGEDYIKLLTDMADGQNRKKTDMLREAIDRLAPLYGFKPLSARPHIHPD